MAKKKKEPAKWVRLSNGVIEKEAGVEAIVAELRGLAMNHPIRFEFLARFVSGHDPDLPDYMVAWLREKKFLQEEADVVLYDDARDVIECCADWFGQRCKFSTAMLYHKDQSDIEPPEDE